MDDRYGHITPTVQSTIGNYSAHGQRFGLLASATGAERTDDLPVGIQFGGTLARIGGQRY